MCNDNSPCFARCSLGKKWYWVTWENFEAVVNRAVFSSGFAPSALDAEEQARASINAGLGHDDPQRLQTYFASGVHRRHAVKQRASRAASSATDAQEIEFVYSDYDSDYDGRWHSVTHRIVKKTPKRVYVEKSDDAWTESSQTYHDVKTFTLDREELETSGCAYSRHRGFFYTTSCEERRTSPTSRCLEILGLAAGATTEAIAAAYRRLAKKHHPDHGGSEKDLKELQRAYETAMNRDGGLS